MALHSALKRIREIRNTVSPKNFLRAQNIQNRVIAGLSTSQQATLKSIDFNPVLGQSRGTATATTAGNPKGLQPETKLTPTHFRLSDERIQSTLRHELGHQLTQQFPDDITKQSIRDHAAFKTFGVTYEAPFGTTVGRPNLANRAFGGPGIKPAGNALDLAKRAAAKVSSAAKKARR